MDILKGFIKKLDFEIKKEKEKLVEIENKISQLNSYKLSLEKKYSSIEKSEYSDPVSISLKASSLLDILNKLKSINKEIESLEKDAEEIRFRLKEKNAEKKAIKKYQEKLKKEKEIEEIKKETRLIDEIFNRKH